ncbi:MAG TPA: tetratricopeptide repeat protein [Vicinamibacterales bacterium]|nr:tetratricopeptide repeat protein [Vicinamibacterales bacterium]
MKRTERHHLKDNELAHLTAEAAGLLQERRGPILGIIVAVIVVLAAAGGYVSWRNRAESRAASQLAAALAVEEARVGPPAAFGQAPSGLSFVSQREKSQAALTKYKEVADAFPGSDAGLFARYRQAATAMALGTPKLAIDAYQQVISQGGDSLYAQMARLGLAEAQAQSGEYDSAINTFRDLSQRKDGPLPVDGLLMRLGRTQAEAGKPTEAEQTFNKLVAEYPDSSFAADARKELDQLKKAS